MTFADAQIKAARALREAGIDAAAGDARRLVAFAAGVRPEALIVMGPDPFDAWDGLQDLIAARIARQPVAQIVGERLFWGRSFRVTPDTLDPRPETEEIVAEALKAPFTRILDLGTGTGCLLLTLLAERGDAEGVGTDVSDAALAVARENANRLGIGPRARLALCDWFGAETGPFDLIVSNPPYIPAAEIAGLAPEVREWEPTGALTDGGDGLGAYRAIAEGAASRLAPGGRLIVECGAGQARDVAAILETGGLTLETILTDMDNRERGAALRLA
ncbi:peptide chain release factor N(5)-glutamine methyltransferase [Roseicyclus sp. F158]|uniref:Release factor glutamine methyltransferase n=1 Tax=Tropicimonas omnivorans TaxID=3075590 RepID=A0ABU3DKU3_9RHOB|nr:peptide chain release factor N(5)-glutamine methyltransferase [Roseicyclus sp. F158]MDT0683727.1 peptide chain release factor N(5)-glutamine methyltransferase [Roseicyclus sp. F158]